ncbi:putative rRNA biogenesis protein rrp5 [Amylocarpus encephaloides]|uniref:rRNA biogenesis protein rrp5 n=1 Tax=Amylocarpus encephaloides TaxID=45428 RepID=A0A9P7YNQ3_9HELO|nr:putative rRNA biogenesis protein rrp5 [Amylocarpus encephaloides]
MATVASVEDHGLVMDLGRSDDIGPGFKFSSVQEGAVLLCMVTADTQKIANPKKLGYLAEAPTVDAFMPGTAVEVLVMGMVDVTMDLVHSGAAQPGKDLEKRFKLGSKIKGRVICTFPNADTPKLGISQAFHNGEKKNPLEVLPLSTIIEEVTVQKVEAAHGLFVDIGIKGVSGFVHISRIKDGKIETISESSGAYKLDSVHRGRVVGYNPFDGTYLISLEASVLEQPFLQVEDLKIGEIIKGKVEKIVVNARGVGGVLVKLTDGISGLVPTAHMADVELQHPERKFKEGMTVVSRVLSTDPSKRQIRLTMKKTLVNSEAPPFLDYENITIGMESPGTIVTVLATGAVVQFYGDVRAFLPVAEMSEAYIRDPSEHFRVGQVVNVHVLKVNPEEKKMVVSCKDPSAFGSAQKTAFDSLKVGSIVSALVTGKSSNDVSLEIEGASLQATLPIGHLTDRSSSRSASALLKIRVGQTMTDLAVLEKRESRHTILLTNKPSLVKAANSGALIGSFNEIQKNKMAQGFVRNIISTAVFVQFGGGLSGYLPKSNMPDDITSLPDFGMKLLQPIEVKITSVNHGQGTFIVSMVDVSKASGGADESTTLINPVDDTLSTLDDLRVGTVTKARIVSVKDTQLNVRLADNAQGRIAVSHMFDTWDQIKNRKRPLSHFAPNQILGVRVMGTFDARNHRFLPLSHRSSTTTVLELSAKPSDLVAKPLEPLALDDIKVGSSWIAYINNIADHFVWASLTPNVRGRIEALELSDDVSLLMDIEANFPVGSAIRVRVKNVDCANNRLDLSARSSKSSDNFTLETLKEGMVVPGKVTKVTERQVMVELCKGLAAPIHLADIADDFSQADINKFAKNDIVRVCVVSLDLPNKKVRLSTRPSRVLDSSLDVQDPEISSISQLKPNDIIRGFVGKVAEKGLLVSLGGNLKAFVRVSDLSDAYLKEWESEFQVDQLVKGKITQVDSTLNHIQMSLKASTFDKNYVAPITFGDLQVGQIITGKIRKVEDFGVFIVIDNSKNVSGLCHQSEMAEKRVQDVKKLYEAGDAVKAKIIKLDADTKRVSFGLKARYFEDATMDSEDDSDDDEDATSEQGARLSVGAESSDDDEGGIDLNDVEDIENSAAEQSYSDSDVEMTGVDEEASLPALSAGGFDWTAKVLDRVDEASDADSDAHGADEKPKKKKRKKAEIKIDRTGDLDANGPQSVGDFERLLLGQPDSSQLWIEYMAFQMQLSELGKARQVAERAIKTINIREETEKMNVWIALINLEAAYGSEESVDEVFKRACQYNDPQEIHERLASIYIQSGKHDKADELFQTIIKRFSQSPTVWYNYAHFLHGGLSAPDRARALLPRAIQSLPPHTHLNLTLKFAALEFHAKTGSPERGRTMFEGLLSTFSKRLDIWNQLLDLEIQQGDEDIIRGVFERVTKTKGLKPKGAKAWFKRWSEWEEKNGDKKSQEKVKAKAEEWVRAASAKRAGGEE